MHRKIVLDTETTGLSPQEGNRIIEIGMIELIDNRPTGNKFHSYINPEGHPIDPGSFKIHNISEQKLRDKPTFKQIFPQIAQFIKDAELLIHNASFDQGFLNAEIERLNHPEYKNVLDIASSVTCTLKMARSLYPKKKQGIDALIKQFSILDEDSLKEKRSTHSAIIDCELLGHIYFYLAEEDKKIPFIDDYKIAKQTRPPVIPIQIQRTPRFIEPIESQHIVQKKMKP